MFSKHFFQKKIKLDKWKDTFKRFCFHEAMIIARKAISWVRSYFDKLALFSKHIRSPISNHNNTTINFR